MMPAAASSGELLKKALAEQLSVAAPRFTRGRYPPPKTPNSANGPNRQLAAVHPPTPIQIKITDGR